VNDVEAIPPCARGCTWPEHDEDAPPRLKPATHGILCASCFYRVKHALTLTPDLMANMRAQVNGFGAAPLTDRVQGGGDGAPLPLRVGPLDALDSLWAKLVTWGDAIAEALGTATPRVHAWRNLTETQGTRPATVEDTARKATALTGWHLDRLDDIAALPLAVAYHDDLAYGTDDARGVFTLAAAYGIEPRPVKPANKRECPVCGELDVFLKWPDKFDPDIAVLCGRCSWVAEPELVGKYAKQLTA